MKQIQPTLACRLCGEDDDEWRPRQTTRDKLEDMLKKAAGKLDKFWTEFSEIYLTELRETHRRTKSEVASVTPIEGEVVLVFENDTPRSQWRTGRITHLVRSADGKIRSAMLKMGKDLKEWRRAINHMYPLEIRDSHKKASETKLVENNELLICNLVMETDELVIDYDEFAELAQEEHAEDEKNASSIESEPAARQVLPSIPLHSKPRARDPFTNKLKSQVVVPSQSRLLQIGGNTGPALQETAPKPVNASLILVQLK
uniref:DUF5641 domain-containing protein n=1 Tax=Ditylenchus dipsaci TaxID=166011 RepID=A0A915DA58_9BILA